MTRLRQSLLCVAPIAALCLVQAAPQQDSARAFLTTTFALSKSDISRVDAGEVVTRTLDAAHTREVGTLGVVRIATTPEQYVERLNDIAKFKRTEDILQIGTFGDSPRVEDLAALTIEEADIRRLRTCRRNDCDVRISADVIEQFASKMDWQVADASQRAADLLRQMLVQYVTRYRERGAAALMTYADSTAHLDVGAELASLIAGDHQTWRHIDNLREHVLTYPHDRVTAKDVIYWSKERVYKRPVISLTHLSIVRQPDEAPVRYAISSKQIYAMHYFDASLGLTLLLPDASASSPATYVIYLNRSRIDLFDGFFGGVAKRIVSGKARTLVGQQLTRLQHTLGS